MNPAWLSESEDGAILAVYVQPRASRNQMAGVQGGELKLRLTAPPVEGAANKGCREFVARLLGVAKGDVELVSGERSRHKRLRVRGLSASSVRQLLGDLAEDEKG